MTWHDGATFVRLIVPKSLTRWFVVCETDRLKKHVMTGKKTNNNDISTTTADRQKRMLAKLCRIIQSTQTCARACM